MHKREERSAYNILVGNPEGKHTMEACMYLRG
jgi:hypothetical protein